MITGRDIYVWKTLGACLIVLMLMPLGHALVILMEHALSPAALHYSAFAMGFVGLAVTLAGVFVKGDTRQTCFGLAGSMLFWMGWVEFLLAYYAERYGVHCDLVGSGVVQTVTQYVDGMAVNRSFTIDGTPLEAFSRQEIKALRGSRPEYLIMPATFGMWMMCVVICAFCTRHGCAFMNWLQRRCGAKNLVELRPMAHHSSIIVFMEWNVLMWGLYLLLMFCYDPVFLGDRHPVTYAVAVACLIASVLLFKRQLHIASWGDSIRMALVAVLVFWTFVEVMARNGFFKEAWVDPVNHVWEMAIVVAVIVAAAGACWMHGVCRKAKNDK